ncbi:MAG: Gfo/Idh/MocA family oxidoreductase [Phycisphaerae bacterium]|jgi:predicted dehydrogenase
MHQPDSPRKKNTITRREFVQSAAAAGLLAAVPTWAQEATAPAKKEDELAIAIIGPGSQGRFLLTKCLKIPNVRFIAVCDIWPYHQNYAANILKKYDQPVNVYEDYREMLDKEKNLDAVIVATPDWMHAEHANACLKAGRHVYCEKEMSNTLEGAASMVRTMRETGKLLQIGHQRRSNPRYFHALKMIEKDKILGRITHCEGQWNRAQLFELGWPEGKELDADTLKRFGYDTMDAFRNWRWYRKFSGGPMADLGSHQVDVFNWFLKTPPKAVLASGGLDYYTGYEGRDWYDNVLAIYEYETPAGPVRGFYQVLNTTSHGGFFETFMGDEGSLDISEDARVGRVFREQTAKKREWEDEAEKVEEMGRDAIELKIGETLTPEGQKTPEAQAMLEQAAKPPHQLHLENFFDSIRGKTKLNCPADVAYEVCVSVLKANEAVASGQRYVFRPEEFRV